MDNRRLTQLVFLVILSLISLAAAAIFFFLSALAYVPELGDGVSIDCGSVLAPQDVDAEGNAAREECSELLLRRTRLAALSQLASTGLIALTVGAVKGRQ